MKKYYLCLVLLSLLFSTSLRAQDKEQGIYPQWSLRTLPSSFADFDAGFMLGVNYRWSEKFSASIEPTWIFYDPYVNTVDGQLFPSGIKIRTDLRIHLSREIRGMEGYLAPEFHYKYTRTKRLEEFGIGCQNGSCAYYQSAVYKELKHELGGMIKMGALKSISNNQRWFLEFYGGLGVKHVKFKETDIPTGGSFLFPPDRGFPGSVFSGSDRNSFFHPMFPGGIKVLFVLK